MVGVAGRGDPLIVHSVTRRALAPQAIAGSLSRLVGDGTVDA